jgi:hypothetical protein
MKVVETKNIKKLAKCSKTWQANEIKVLFLLELNMYVNIYSLSTCDVIDTLQE